MKAEDLQFQHQVELGKRFGVLAHLPSEFIQNPTLKMKGFWGFGVLGFGVWGFV